MPSRAESRIAPVPFLTIGGVNQRVQITELKPHEYVDIQGVFPEFAGLQSRIWGKRTLAKYDNAIYGIHQFWTPMGYGGGLYQFNGSVDFGQWLTPSSAIILDPIDLGIDGGGMTLDEFGLGWGSNFGYGDVNTCVISFLNGSTDHSACNPSPSPANTPDDNNGGPAGQGRHCQWESITEDRDLSNFAVAQKSASLTNIVSIGSFDNCRNPADGLNPPCQDFPPLPVPAGTPPSVGSFSPVTITGVLAASTSVNTIAIFNPPSNLICSLAVGELQGNTLSDTKITVNFASLQDLHIDQITLLAVKTPGGAIEIPLSLNNYEDLELTAGDHLTLGAPTLNADFGHLVQGSVSASQVRLYYRKRVCS